MKTTLLARKLDVAEFARQGGELEGSWSPSDPVHWRARGERRVFAGAEQTWLHLEISADVPRECQRCLAPVIEHLKLSRDYRFVPTETEAEREDGESEEDVLALTRTLDLAALCEDEILMSLPVVPLHDVCPQPLVPGADSADLSVEVAPDGELGAEDEAGREHPFAALESLRGKLH